MNIKKLPFWVYDWGLLLIFPSKVRFSYTAPPAPPPLRHDITTTVAGSEEQKIKIKIGLFIPGDIGGWEESKSLIPMGHVAKNQINNSSDVLDDYQVELQWFNTKVSSMMDSMMDSMLTA